MVSCTLGYSNVAMVTPPTHSTGSYCAIACFHEGKSLYRRSGNFRCKNIFVVCANHENKKHEIYFTTDIHYSNFVRTISQHSYLVISCETVSSIPACHSNSWQMRRQLFAQCPINRPFTATVRAYGVIRFPFAR